MSVKESRVKKTFWKTDRFVGLMVILTFWLASGADLMPELEWKAYDLGVRFSSTDPANTDVVVHYRKALTITRS